jgi:hypothetical protein
MSLMEPVDTFTLTLRGYQKQALSYVHLLSHSIFYPHIVQLDVFYGVSVSVCEIGSFNAPSVERVRRY